ncbi:Uncharacterised protein [Aeromonas salmonicida]|nr:Uncharacterised protein [Aeromonas salmonicida]
MNCMEFKLFGDVSAEDFLPLVNDETVRKHLIDHPPFDAASVRVWMDDKIRIDMLPGCRVRALVIDGALVGWCGIQPDGEGVEIAIVIAKAGWGAWLYHLLPQRRTMVCALMVDNQCVASAWSTAR